MKYLHKNLIFFITLIILFYILNSVKDNFLVNDRKWENYRLGDIVKYWTNKKYEKYNYEYINSIKYNYKNSIGDIYLKKNTKKIRNNYELLKKIVYQKSNNIILPKNDEIILHLRIGDSIKGYKNGIFHYNGNYPTRIEDIEKMIPLLKNKKIIIIYGQHHLYNNSRIKENNEIYLDKIKNILKKNNINFKEKITQNPDEDFIFMCNAKTFIKSGGGYSYLISKIVNMNNNRVIDPYKL